MTPGIKVAKQSRVGHKIHEYEHDISCKSFGLEAAQKLGVEPGVIFKTLVVSLDNKTLAVAIIPVASKLSMKHIAKVAGAKKAVLAEPHIVERSTGYVLGGVSPLGQKKQLKTYIDISASILERVFISAGRRGLEIELAPSDLQYLTKAAYCQLCH